MDQNALVEFGNDAGQRLVESLQKAGLDISVAFWARADGEERWFLYLAMPAVETIGEANVYLKVHKLLRQMPGSGIGPFDVRAVTPDDSMAAAALQVVAPRKANSPFAVENPKPYAGITRFGGHSLGGVNIEGAYIYPPPAPANV